MATTAYGIATYDDVVADYPDVLDGGGNQCITYLELNQKGFYISSQYRSYTNNQLVVYSDILGHESGGSGGSTTPAEYYIEDALQAMVLMFEGGTCTESILVLSSNPAHVEALRGCTITIMLMMTATAGPTTTITIPTNQTSNQVAGPANPFKVPYANTAATFTVRGVTGGNNNVTWKGRGTTLPVQKVGS